MAPNNATREGGKDSITDGGDGGSAGRRSFLKLLGTVGVAAGIGQSMTTTGAAQSGDPFDYVKEVVLNGNYTRTVTQDRADAVVRSRDELVDVLSGASRGDVVFVPSDAVIDLTNGGDIGIPGGVTLASDRCVDGSAGGLLFCDDKQLPLLRTEGSDVRVTGLRLRGNHPEGYHEFTEWNESAAGIQVDHGDVEIDNCELWGWGYASVMARSADLHVHHNHIHHNEEDGLGYGVHCGSGHTIIEYNYFLHNRHAIAGGGSTTGYTARFNLVGPEAKHHAFDMHRPGGNRIDIHHNKFEYDHTMFDNPIEAVKIRGVPEDVCEITQNWFHHDSPPGDEPVDYHGEAIDQDGAGGEWSNLSFSSNYYGPDTAPDYDRSYLVDNDPTADGDPGNGSGENPRANAHTFEVRTDVDPSEVTYEFVADGRVTQAADDVEDNDDATDNGDGTWTATGTTGNGYDDVWDVEGEVLEFSASNEDVVTLVFDETDVTDDLLGSDEDSNDDSDDDSDDVTQRTFEIQTTEDGGETTYEFVADGRVTQVDKESNDEATDNGDGTWTATGTTGNGYADAWTVEGDVLEFSAANGDIVTLVLDGTDVTDDLLGSEDDPDDGSDDGSEDDSDDGSGDDPGDGSDLPNVITFNGQPASGHSTYSFTVTGSIEAADASLEDGDVISGNSVEAELPAGDVDSYRYSGRLTSFGVDGAATIDFQ